MRNKMQNTLNICAKGCRDNSKKSKINECK